MISERGLALIREFEGLRLAAYPDPATGGDPWTIGYGHTKGVKQGDTCTKEQAEEWLRADAQEAAIAVLRAVVIRLSQSQLDALTSFVFNLGIGNLRKSTLLKKLNAADPAAADEFAKWTYAAGKVMPGLVRRRAAEAALFKEKEMLPFIAAAIPALIQAAPSLIRIFGESPQSEKNAKAAELVAEIAKTATGQPTTEGAVHAIESDPAQAAAYREAIHQNMGELVSLSIQVSEAEDKSRGAALDRNLALANASGGRWLWLLGAIAVIVVLVSYGITAGVLFTSTTFSDETKAMLLGQVVIFGFVTVLAFLFGSNIQNRLDKK